MSRESNIHHARVYLTECRARRNDRVSRDFYWRLFAWAQGARGRAMAACEPMQGGLFS